MMIEVTNEETLKLIQSLEKLHLLKVVQPARKKVVFDKSWSGSISKETADAMLAQVEESKEEWDRGY
jgi:hypothetical protein